MWERVVGQDRAVRVLRRAAAEPAHAFLLVGPPGSGLAEASRCFAAAVLCEQQGCGDCSVCDRALRGRHPDVNEVEPEGTQMRVEQAASIVEAAFRTPVETSRKVVVLREAERMNEQSQNKLLKTFEEPPSGTTFVLLTSAPEELLETVRSRCQRVDFGALAAATVREALESDGVEGELAALVARLSGGRMDRARFLAGDGREMREVFVAAPARIEGSGGAAAVVAGDLMEAVDGACAAQRRRHEREREELEAEVEQVGYPQQTARRLQRSLEERHRRLEQRATQDALADGLTVLESVYRDSLVGGDAALNRDRAPLSLAPEACLEAIDACSAARRKVQEGIVLNWALMLEHLCLHLPAPAEAAGLDPHG